MEYPRLGPLPNGMVRLPNGRVITREEYERLSQRMPINTAGTPVGIEPPVGPAEKVAPPTPAPRQMTVPTMTHPTLAERDGLMPTMTHPTLAERDAAPEESKPSGLLDILLSQKTGDAKPKRTGKDWAEAIGAGLLSMSNNPGLQKLGLYGFERMGTRRDEERALAKTNRTVDALVAAGVVKPEQADALRNNPDLIKTVYEQALKGNTPLSPAGKLASDLKSGLITQEQYDAEIARLAKSGVTVENIIGGTKYIDKVNEQLATEFGDIVRQGTSAAKSLQEVAQLEQFLMNAPQGGTGAFIQFASNLGIKLEGSSEIEAATAIINRLVPAQRPPGSGPMSDADLVLFKQSLPRIINSPQGNQLIIQTLKAIATYDMKMAQIANKARMNPEEYSPEQAYADMQKLTNPLGWLDQSPLAAPAPAGATGTPVKPDSIPQEVWDEMTTSERALFPGAK